MKKKIRSLFLSGPAGKLEALWEEPEGARGDWSGLVCHPHPLYGGTLHNKVVHHTARALQELGLPVLRFNFRGAGRSQGRHDQGCGEQDDVRAALAYLENQRPGAGIVLAGFSFGAGVGLRVGCGNAPVRALIGVGLPANNDDLSYLAACPKPKLFVQGSHDQFGGRESVEAVVQKAAAPKKLVFIEGADHFFNGHLPELRRAIQENFPLH
ncbi:alpha/beta hydrolase [Acidobacteriia bacterium AH_259_A11_L15]|nr:alpha/beta hydrolase [Acidobacteriia bacterium AH_259_A11_L15]